MAVAVVVVVVVVTHAHIHAQTSAEIQDHEQGQNGHVHSATEKSLGNLPHRRVAYVIRDIVGFAEK